MTPGRDAAVRLTDRRNAWVHPEGQDLGSLDRATVPAYQ